MRIFTSPASPILSYSSSNIEHFRQSLFDFFLQPTILFPWMKRSHNIFFFCPCTKMFYNFVDDASVFLVTLLKIVFNLIGVIALSHKTVCNCVYLIIALAGYFFSNIPNIIIIPIFLLIDICKGRFDAIKLNSFHYRGKIVSPWN